MSSPQKGQTPEEYQNYLTDHLNDAYGPDIEAASKIKKAYHLSNILPLVRCDKNAQVLEIGPGYGEMIGILRSAGFTEVSSIDISPEVVEHIQRVYGANSCEHAADVEAYLSDKHNKYGCIIMLDVLEHIPRELVVPMLRSIHFALSPGGSVIIQTCNASSPFGENIYFSDFTHQWDFTEFSLRQVLSNAGFKNSIILGYKFPTGIVGLIRTILRKVLHLGYFLGAIINGIVRVRVLDPNLVAIGKK